MLFKVALLDFDASLESFLRCVQSSVIVVSKQAATTAYKLFCERLAHGVSREDGDRVRREMGSVRGRVRAERETDSRQTLSGVICKTLMSATFAQSNIAVIRACEKQGMNSEWSR